ncbi:MAG: hypothetical protein IJA88_00185 [Clostridia bacterium]|nr:hypothetical protein [Clostridia bacterium]
MREVAKETFLELKEKDKEVKKVFEEYVDDLVTRLEIPREIAANVVADNLVSEYESRLIALSIFRKDTFDKYFANQDTLKETTDGKA